MSRQAGLKIQETVKSYSLIYLFFKILALGYWGFCLCYTLDSVDPHINTRTHIYVYLVYFFYVYIII